MIQQVNHQEIGLSRIATQYRESEKFKGWLRALLRDCDNLESALHQILLAVDIDHATGFMLDVIGDIVGAYRVVERSINLAFFGFNGQPEALSMGEEGRHGIGGRFRNEKEVYTQTAHLDDAEYRTLIKAKIIRNHSRGTHEDILQSLRALFGAEYAYVDASSQMKIVISLGRPITSIEQAFITDLDILPRPGGVRIELLTFDADRVFGFEHQNGALGFGDEFDYLVGGVFAEEII